MYTLHIRKKSQAIKLFLLFCRRYNNDWYFLNTYRNFLHTAMSLIFVKICLFFSENYRIKKENQIKWLITYQCFYDLLSFEIIYILVVATKKQSNNSFLSNIYVVWTVLWLQGKYNKNNSCHNEKTSLYILSLYILHILKVKSLFFSCCH